jgi:hypothetical protein
MVVHVNLGKVRWIKADRVARKPRRKRQRWLFTGLATESGYPRISTVRANAVVKTESVRTSKRIPKVRRSKLIWLPE